MNTILVSLRFSLEVGHSSSASRAIMTWRTISAEVRLRTSFCVPVWQNEQFSVQPTWDETQSAPARPWSRTDASCTLLKGRRTLWLSLQTNSTTQKCSQPAIQTCLRLRSLLRAQASLTRMLVMYSFADGVQRRQTPRLGRKGWSIAEQGSAVTLN